MSSTFDIRTLLGGLFIPIGMIAFIIASGLGIESYRLFKEGVRRPGTVISIQRSTAGKRNTFYPIIRFQTPEGTSYEIRSNFTSNPPAYEVGESVGVIYHVNKPQEASIDGVFGLWFGPLLAGFIGAIFMAIGIYGLGSYLKQKKLQAWLKQHGTRVPTKVIAIEENTRIRVNRSHPFQIVSEGITPFKTGPQTFRSQNIWKDPTLITPVGSSIDVLIDPNDGTRYWMDITPTLSSTALSSNPKLP